MQAASKLMLPQASTVENLSYGNLPFTMPPSGTGAMIPQVKTGRKAEVADLVGMITGGVPGAKTVAGVGTKLSNEAADALVRMITRNPQATAPAVLQEAGQMVPLARMFKPEQAAKVIPETKAIDEAGNPRLMYHGTPKVVDRLEPQKRGFVSLSPDPDFASRYAGQEYTIEVMGENPNMWPVYADIRNPFDYENPSHVKMVMDEVKFPKNVSKEAVQENISLGNWNFIEDKKVQEAIKKLGFDSFYMKEMGVKNIGIFNPEQVKSAVSDPIFGLLDEVPVKGVEKMYHGTSPEAAKQIERSGFDINKSADGTVWFTSNPQIGEVAATNKGAVVERLADLNKLKLGGWKETDKYSVDELIQQGYDGLRLVDGNEITYQIFNPEKLRKPLKK